MKEDITSFEEKEDIIGMNLMPDGDENGEGFTVDPDIEETPNEIG